MMNITFNNNSITFNLNWDCFTALWVPGVEEHGQIEASVDKW